MATYRARLSMDPAGNWVASAIELPNCWSSAATRDAALERLRDEIRYRIEFCPCSGVDDAYVQVDVQPVDPPVGTVAPRTADNRQPHSSTSAQRPPVAPLSGVLGCPPEASRSRDGASSRRLQTLADTPPSGWRRWDD